MLLILLSCAGPSGQDTAPKVTVEAAVSCPLVLGKTDIDEPISQILRAQVDDNGTIHAVVGVTDDSGEYQRRRVRIPLDGDVESLVDDAFGRPMYEIFMVSRAGYVLYDVDQDGTRCLAFDGHEGPKLLTCDEDVRALGVFAYGAAAFRSVDGDWELLQLTSDAETVVTFRGDELSPMGNNGESWPVETVDQIAVSDDGLISARFTFTPDDSSQAQAIAQWDGDGNEQLVSVVWSKDGLVLNGKLSELNFDGFDPSVYGDAPLAGLTLDAGGNPMFLWNILDDDLASVGAVMRADPDEADLLHVLNVNHDFGDSLDGAATEQTLPQLSYLSYEGTSPNQHGGTLIYGTYQGSLGAVLKVKDDGTYKATVVAYEGDTDQGALSDNPHLRGVVGSAGGHIALLADSTSGAGALYVVSTDDKTGVVLELGATVGGLKGRSSAFS